MIRIGSRSWGSRRAAPASTAGTHFDAGKSDASDPIEQVSSRPDRLILVYPVITFMPPYRHSGSQRNLLGDNPSPELVENLSNDRQVTKDTPPTFLAHTNADSGVAAENSILFALAPEGWRAGRASSLRARRHGLGLGGGSVEHKIPADEAFKAWPKLCETWLKNQGFLDKKSAGK